MNNKFFLIILLLYFYSSCFAQQGRFLHRVFDNFSVISNVPYTLASPVGTDDPRPYSFDFYEPIGDTMSKRPLVITVFGGAFIAGNRTWCDMLAYADSLTHYGYTVASIDYRLLPVLSVSETNFIRSAYMAAQDVSAAIRYFKGNADTYRIDTNQIFVLGNSAGTIASMHAIWVDDDQRPEATYADEGWLGIGARNDLGGVHSAGLPEYLAYSPNIAGLVAQWGGVLDTNFIDQDDTTPVCLIHGTADESVPFDSGIPYESYLFGISGLILPTVYGSYYLDKRLNNYQICHEFHAFEGEPHCFYLDGWTTLLPDKLDTCFRVAINFMARYNTHLNEVLNLNEPSTTAFRVFPNPTSDEVCIHFETPMDIFHYTLYNAQGQVVLRGQNQLKFNIAHLPAGIYLLQINDERQWQKIMKW